MSTHKNSIELIWPITWKSLGYFVDDCNEVLDSNDIIGKLSWINVERLLEQKVEYCEAQWISGDELLGIISSNIEFIGMNQLWRNYSMNKLRECFTCWEVEEMYASTKNT
jgi:hypothetical protein